MLSYSRRKRRPQNNTSYVQVTYTLWKNNDVNETIKVKFIFRGGINDKVISLGERLIPLDPLSYLACKRTNHFLLGPPIEITQLTKARNEIHQGKPIFIPIPRFPEFLNLLKTTGYPSDTSDQLFNEWLQEEFSRPWNKQGTFHLSQRLNEVVETRRKSPKVKS